MSEGVPAGELLPCPNPWCASHRRSETRESYAPYVKLFTGGYYRVTCAVCPQIGPSKREADDAITAWNTRATPAGWVLVPVEPSGGQLEAGLMALSNAGVDDACVGDARNAYYAMLDAAPATPTPPIEGRDADVERVADPAPDEDWLADVIDDSLDMDWTGRIGARAIIAAWGQRHGR